MKEPSFTVFSLSQSFIFASLLSYLLLMVRSLFDIALATVCQRDLDYDADLALLPCDCKQRLLEFFASHDQVERRGGVRRRYFEFNEKLLWKVFSGLLEW